MSTTWTTEKQEDGNSRVIRCGEVINGEVIKCGQTLFGSTIKCGQTLSWWTEETEQEAT